MHSNEILKLVVQYLQRVFDDNSRCNFTQISFSGNYGRNKKIPNEYILIYMYLLPTII